MDITNVNHMSGAIPTGKPAQSSQDSHEKNIQSQIASLQVKMRDLANNNTLSEDEKSDKKKKLKEQIQNLNSELKQYKINKRREKSGENQDDGAKGAQLSDETPGKASTDRTNTDAQSVSKAVDETDKAGAAANLGSTATGDSTIKADSANGIENNRNSDSQVQSGKQEFAISGAETEMMVSFSNTMQQFANMGKIQTQLSGLMRTAETDEEKIELQGKINSVSDAISAKADKNVRKLSEIRDDERKKKEKRRRMLEEQAARRENMKASVPKSGKSFLEDGKVLLTRKKA